MKARVMMGAAVAAALLASAGCATQHNSQSSAAPVPVGAHARFDTAAGVALPSEATEDNSVLYQATAYINTPHGVIVFDTAAGKTLRVRTAPHQASASGDASNFIRPVPGTVDGAQVMAVMVPVSPPDQAASSATQTFEVLLIDATRGILIRTITTQLKRPDTNRHEAWAVAIAGNDLIVNNMGTVRISLTDGTLRWTAASGESVTAAGDDGNRLIGATAYSGQAHLHTIDTDTGGTLWTDPAEAGTSIGIHPAGPRFVVSTSQNFTKIVNVDTGETIAALQPPTNDGLRCFYDQQATTICSVPGKWSMAFDAASGQTLWASNTSAGNTALITVSTAFQGRVYARTATGQVLLDARSGQATESTLTVAPIVVSEHTGIVKAASGALTAYPVRF